jgi:hypothetical protein
MKVIAKLILIFIISTLTYGQVRTVHVYVPLCDNQYQGIVPVPKSLGNGKEPSRNLYWGAAYGVKTHFKKTPDWKLIKSLTSKNPAILERVLFKHATKNIYMLADAYDGERIKSCIEDFLKASNGMNPVIINSDSLKLNFGGQSDLLAYAGHDGLMDFSVDINYVKVIKKRKDVIILACYSKAFFTPEIIKAKANPLLWTTHLMAPEAYTLKAALDGWIVNESGTKIDERAAQAYNKYQKCGIKGARNLFTSGYK